MALVSVLVPMRNAEPFVRASLESVLNQEGVELEVVVIDDGSTDDSARVVRDMNDARVRIVPGPCKGISLALNTALAEAKGDIVVRCDSDDLYPPGRLVWQVQWLNEHPDFGAVCGYFSTIDPKGNLLADLECGGREAVEITEELRSGKTRTHFCTFAIRTELLRRIGGCRPWFRTGEDIDLQLRLADECRIWFEPKPCYQYRLHGASITHNSNVSLHDFYEATARSFAAQRRAGAPDDLEQGRPPEPPSDQGGPKDDARTHVQEMLLGRAWGEHRDGHRLEAVRLGFRACLARPGRLAAWKSLAALIVKRSARE